MMLNNAIAIISDVHSNLEALEAVLEDIEKNGIKKIISLGDIVGYGASPNEVIALFKKHKIESVRGNHDATVVYEKSFTDFNVHARNALKITKNLLTPESKKYLKSLKDFLVIDGVRFVHGCPPDSYKEYMWYSRSKDALNMFGEGLCFVGHTHQTFAYRKIDGKFGVNSVEQINLKEALSIVVEKDEKFIVIPGSVSMPRDHLINAKYCILHNYEAEKEIELRCIEYNVEKAASKIKKVMKDDVLIKMLYGEINSI